MTNLPPEESRTSMGADVSELFRTHCEPMTRLAFVLTSNAEVSDEIVQDAFLKVHASWDQIDNPVAYLRRAVINGCHSHHRRLRVERRAPVARGRSSSLAANELGDALAKLAHPRRAVLALRYFCDLTDLEIAQILGCRPATPQPHLSRTHRSTQGDPAMSTTPTLEDRLHAHYLTKADELHLPPMEFNDLFNSTRPVAIASLQPAWPRRTASFAAAALVLVVVAVAAVATRDNASVAPASTPSSQASSVASTASVPTTAAASTPVTTALALVVGDSLDLGASDELIAAGLLVNADINRQATSETVRGVIQPLRDNGTLPEVVIVHLGSNAPATAENYDNIARLLADRHLVIFVTVHVNASWASQNNEHIQRLPSRYPNVEIVDWASQVDAGNVPGGIAPDGFHVLTVEARQFYTELLVGAISVP